jgi:hypothetical protein
MLQHNGLLAVVLHHQQQGRDGTARDTQGAFRLLADYLYSTVAVRAEPLLLAQLNVADYAAAEHAALSIARWLVLVAAGRGELPPELHRAPEQSPGEPLRRLCRDIAKTRSGRAAAFALPSLVVRCGFRLAVAFHAKSNPTLAALLFHETLRAAGLSRADWQDQASASLVQSSALDALAQRAAVVIAQNVDAAEDWEAWTAEHTASGEAKNDCA